MSELFFSTKLTESLAKINAAQNGLNVTLSKVPLDTVTNPSTLDQIKKENVKMCTVLKKTDDLLKQISGGIPNIPTACDKGLGKLEPCSKAFFLASVDRIKALHMEINQLKCNLTARERELADHIQAVKACSKSVKANLAECSPCDTGCPAPCSTSTSTKSKEYVLVKKMKKKKSSTKCARKRGTRVKVKRQKAGACRTNVWYP